MKNKRKGILFLIIAIISVLVALLGVVAKVAIAETVDINENTAFRARSFSGSYGDTFIQSIADTEPTLCETTTYYGGAKRAGTTYRISHPGYNMLAYVELYSTRDRDLDQTIKLSSHTVKSVSIFEMTSVTPTGIFHEGSSYNYNLTEICKYFATRYTRT